MRSIHNAPVADDARRWAQVVLSSNLGAPIIHFFPLKVFAEVDPAAEPWLCGVSGKPSGLRCRQAVGCFRMSAKACKRAESAGLFAVAALFSNDGAMLFSFATLPLLMCERSEEHTSELQSLTNLV